MVVRVGYVVVVCLWLALAHLTECVVVRELEQSTLLPTNGLVTNRAGGADTANPANPVALLLRDIISTIHTGMTVIAFGEFTLKGTVHRFDKPATTPAELKQEKVAIYAKNSQPPVLEMMTTLHENGKEFVELTKGGHVYSGVLTNGNQLKIESCDEPTVGHLSSPTGSHIFQDIQHCSLRRQSVPNPKSHAVKKMNVAKDCPECTVVCRVTFGGYEWMLFAVGGTGKFNPKLLVSRDATVKIEEFSQSRTWTPPTQTNCPAPVDGPGMPKPASGVFNAVSHLLRSSTPPNSRSTSSSVPSAGSSSSAPVRNVPLLTMSPPRSTSAGISVLEVQEQAYAVLRDPVLAKLGSKDSSGIYTVQDKSYLGLAQLWTTKMYFKQSSTGRWLWSPFKDRSSCWMSVETVVVWCTGKYHKSSPTGPNRNLIDDLRNRERTSDVGKGPPDAAAITSLLGSPRSSGSQLWISKVKGATNLHIKAEQKNGLRVWSWSPDGSNWMPVTTDTVQCSGCRWKGKQPQTLNLRIIHALKYWQGLESKHSDANDNDAVTPENPNAPLVCKTEWKGDGLCDKICNNEQHNWDGGDCCRGTCLDSQYVCGSNGFHCKAQAKGRVCLFLHGAGIPGKYPPTYGSTQPLSGGNARTLGYQGYWADMRVEMEGLCSQVIYSNADTTTKPWTDKVLQDSYYQKAKEVYDTGGVVFCHSMANLILGGACLDGGKCGVKWYQIGGPVRGSAAADGKTDLDNFLGTKSSVVTKSFRLDSRAMMLATQQREAMGRLLHDKGLLLGNMCGTTGWGSGGAMGAGLETLKTVVYGSSSKAKADGMVGLHECELFGWKDKDTWKTWYLTGSPGKRHFTSPSRHTTGNHGDQPGLNGNHDHILDWYRAMAKRT